MDNELVEAVAYSVANAKLGEGPGMRCEGPTEYEIGVARQWVRRVLAATPLASLKAENEALRGDWFDKAIRAHCDEHGPSGGAWNISMVLERLHSARAALTKQGG